MSDALASLEAQNIFLTNHLDAYLGACQTDGQKNLVRSNYVDCRRNYWNCINKIFHDNDPKVAAAVEQMQTAQTSLEQSLDHLENIANVLDLVTDAVKAGGQLAALAG